MVHFDMIALALVLLLAVSPLVSCHTGHFTIPSKKKSSWKPGSLVNPVRLHIPALELRGGGPTEVPDDTVDDHAEGSTSATLGTMAKKATIWYFQACKRACVAALEEFQKPVHLQEENGVAKALVWGLTKIQRMTIRSTRAFWRAEQGNEKVKREASKILKRSNGLTTTTTRRSKRGKCVREVASTKIKGGTQEGGNSDITKIKEGTQEGRSSDIELLKLEVELQWQDNDKMNLTVSDIRLANSTTMSSSGAPPATRKKTHLEWVVQMARMVNRISAFAILIASIAFFVGKAWESRATILSAGAGMIGEKERQQQQQQPKEDGPKEEPKQQQQQQQPKEEPKQQQQPNEREKRRPLKRAAQPTYQPVIAR